jgi:hypothetical protein
VEDHKEFTVAEKVAERKGNLPQCRTNFYFLQEQEGLSSSHCSVRTGSETHSHASSDDGKNMWMFTSIPTYTGVAAPQIANKMGFKKKKVVRTAAILLLLTVVN